MRFGVLGPLVVRTPDGRPVHVPEVKVRALLTVLLIHAGRPVSADRLIDDLWNGRPPAGAAAALRVKVSQLRRALGERELVAYRAPGYVLRAEPDSVDAGHFASLLGRAQRTDDLEVRASLLRQALGLWRGGAYAEFADEPFARAAVARLDEQRLVAEEELAETRLALGEHGLLAADLTDLVAAHPLRERLRAAHVRALYLAGRQGEALASHRDLRRRLAEDLGLDPGPELAALHQAILSRDPSLTPPPTRPRTNLPAPLTRLVGRDEAVTKVRALLRTNRLVTLTGPGGVGKTRLALAAANPNTRSAIATKRLDGGDSNGEGVGDGGFDGGVWLVELASLGAGAGVVEVAEAIADVLGVRDDAPGGILERLPGTLRAGRTLLVLDNCEHVVEQVATLADRLLRAAPGLRILATSQESLRIEGEALWSVPPLDRAAAIELFTTRAGLKTTTTTPTSTGIGTIGAGTDARDSAGVDADVAEICARLDGIPLALELAATRMRVLTPRQLAERLDDRFRLLASGLRGAPARQQTLRAMIDWSWELLSDDERVVLRRLSVHADGCTLEAAEEVCAEPGVDVLDTLARLVDRSLVVRVEGPRYRLLESVAAYCVERLREAGEHDRIRERHARYYTALAARADLRGPGQREWLARLDAESANLRLALAGPESLRLVNALAWYWILRGRLNEGRRSLTAALRGATPAAGEGEVARASVWLAGIESLIGGSASPVRWDGLDAAGVALADWLLSHVRWAYGDHRAHEAAADRALVAFEALGDRWGVAAALCLRAKLAVGRADLAAMERDGRRGLALFEELGDAWGRIEAMDVLDRAAEIRGDYAEARRLRREGLRLAEELGFEVSFKLAGLGRIALLAGDYVRADDYHERAATSTATDGRWMFSSESARPVTMMAAGTPSA
ncbi:BTAD domain-containing putative transcriptional regulator, partial [Nonomuraea fuscirosea]